MHMFLRLVLTSLFVVFGLVIGRGLAHADSSSIHNYFEGMEQLLPVIGEWQADIEGQLTAVAAKPELSCADEFAAIVRRGHGLAEDLRGTGTLAPSMLRDRHDAALAGFDRAVGGAQLLAASCDGSGHGAGAEDITAGHVEYESAIRLVRYYTARLR